MIHRKEKGTAATVPFLCCCCLFLLIHPIADPMTYCTCNNRRNYRNDNLHRKSPPSCSFRGRQPCNYNIVKNRIIKNKLFLYDIKKTQERMCICNLEFKIN